MIASQRDIADLTGLSQATVSLALKGHPRIPAETRERVLAAAQELGYSPHPFVQALMASRKQKEGTAPDFPTILYLCDYPQSLEQHSLEQLRSGVTETATELGFVIEHVPTPVTADDLASLSKMIHTRNIRGVILGPTLTIRTLPDLNWESLAVIAISEFFASGEVDRITSDHFSNVRLGLESLIAEGARRPGIIYPKENNRIVNRGFSAGFLDFAAEHAARCHFPKPLELESTDPPPELIRRWHTEERPDAILFFPLLILETVSTLQDPKPKLGLIQWSRQPRFPCGGVDIHASEVGRIATRAVASKIAHSQFGLRSNPLITLVRGNWVSEEKV